MSLEFNDITNLEGFGKMEKRDLDIIMNSAVNWQMYRNKVCLLYTSCVQTCNIQHETMLFIEYNYS